MASVGSPGDEVLTPKGRATRERIVATAAELILAEGLSTLNMDKLRVAAAVSGSQLAHYFADKQALVRAVLERQLNVVLDFHRQPKLRGLDTFEDFERWIDLNMRYLRRIGYSGTPTYHALAGQLAKSDDATRATLAAGYWQWVALLERSIGRMRSRGVLVADADPRRLALSIVCAHQGGGTMTFTYRQEWPHADAVRFAVNHLRMYAADPAERAARPARRPRGQRASPVRDGGDSPVTFTRKGLATRARIVQAAAGLMFERGAAGTSIDDVRRSAAVSGSQITHYFQGRRDLMRQVIGTRRADVMAFHRRPPLGGLDSLAALHAWVDACLADVDGVYLRGGCVYGSLAGELLEADDEILDDLAAGYDQWLALFRAGLTAMRGRGDLRADADPRHLAIALVAAHQGGAMLTFATGSPEPLTAALHAAVDYVGSFAPPRGDRAPRRKS
ncbi:TetR/AcrR family transcriptional regulator [Mycobacterium sp. pUA109]|uniref:TetR/AcrR family transcriptional regulator n=1 Tax=Mycobacterium sp. pUA109 TaxID=3238982 RepID=UPI00351B1920